jgi:hypothetical protein
VEQRLQLGGGLVGERGWSPGDYTERTVRSILAEVVTQPPASR